VGAFRELALAQSAAKAIGLAQLRIIATLRDEQDWYVLVLGAYAERVDAREAGEAYLNAYPHGVIWVRETTDLKKSLISK
jgi:septal ring-binding cell division protein DamX